MRLQWGGFEYEDKLGGVKTTTFSTMNRNLVMSKYYVEMGFLVETTHVFGFGERQKSFELAPGEYTSWTDGRENRVEKGKRGGNSYGDHPFVLCKLKDNTFSGIFFKNSNAKVLNYTHVDENRSILDFKAVGGTLDFFFFIGETADDVIKSYLNVIGRPYFPPFWSLGFHQSARRYNQTSVINDVMNAYKLSDMPLESIWLDIEFMDRYRNFEINKTRFPNFASTASAIHKNGQKIIPIVDAGLAADLSYNTYKEAYENNHLIIDPLTGQPLFGEVWPGKAGFIDFLHPGSNYFWIKWLEYLYKSVFMDGIWLDMNEVTSFCNGRCSKATNDGEKNYTYPYNPTGDTKYTIQSMTLPLDGQHYGITKEQNETNIEYNLHSLYGTHQAEATFQYWKQTTSLTGKRPFVLSRSTFAGAGKYTSHWLGDNYSRWEYMQYSIAGIMDFNMFGIPLVGADVCGFYENFDQEMCARWMQLSAFYPFARNNYNLTDKGGDLLKPQELYNLVDPYKSAAKNAINQRYSYLRYYYTLLYEISWGRRASMVRPLFFEFPDDSNTYKGYEHSFMIGNALKVTPVITEEDSKNQKVSSYFPKGSRFISLNDFKTIVKGGDSGANVTIGASWSSTIVHMKDGTIIPYQDTLEKKFAVTDNLISKDGLDLLVFPDINGYAEGSVYIDNDGTSQKDLDNGQFEYYKIRFTQNTLTIDLIDGKGSSGDRTLGNHVIQNVYILGQFDESLENRTQVCAFSSSMVPKDIQMSYDKTRGIIRLNVTNGTPLYFHDTHAIQYATSDEDVSFCAPKYKVDKVTTVLTADGKQKRVLNVVNATDSGLPNFIATFTMVQNRILRIEIIDEYQTEYRVTDQVFNPKLLPLDGHGVTTDISSVLTTPAEGEDFYFEVHALNNPKVVLYSTKGQEFIHTQYYKKTTSIINNDGHIFGLGERVGDFFLKDGIYTLWARDEPSPTETAKRPGNNVYGTHPVYFSKMKTNNDFFAVFDNNAGAQDFIIESDKNGKKITHIQTSGMTDMFIILNSNLQNVTAEFINLIGKPTMVPEWALGWHQCRYGYNDSRLVSDVVTKFIEYQLPLDAMWTDIEYMDMYKDFSVSQKNFPDLNTLIAGWKKQNIRYVPILDAAIAYEKVAKNTAFQRGTAADVFILDPVEQFKPFVGKVWPGPAVYIDWLTDNAKLFWVKELGALQGLIDFDGMWIDMNEASNFCNGFCSKKVKLDLPIQDHLFYTPGARDLNTKSISIDALHHNHVTEFEVHSLYGFYMSIATSSYFTETLGKRAFVITRSSYTGVGKFASHWLGDNFSTFEMLKYSIGGIYLFSFYGVPVTGADICGFIFNTYPELCARWYAVGAFYPFSRNHNDKAAIPQEPYVDMFSKAIISAKTNATYTDFFREASLKRYSLHIYQYSYIHKASTDGTLYFKPQFYNYPDETKAYLNVESDILLGDSVKLAAMVNPGTIGTFYFPGKNTQWCPIWPKYKYECLSGETTQIFKEVLYDEILAYIKSGSIIPLQNAIDGGFKEENEDFSFDYSSYQNKLPQDGEHYTLEFAKTKPVDIAVLMDKGNSASGWLRYDDGMTQDLNKYTEVKISATGYTSLIFTNYIDLTFSVFKDDSTVKDTMNQKLGSVVVYSAKSYSLGANSACQITTMTGSFIDCTPVYYKTSNIVKYMVKDGLEPDLRNVKSIHISSK